MKNGISRLEARVERLVEGTFARLFAGRLHPREVALKLARAMEDQAHAANGPARAPEAYRVRLSEADAAALLAAEPGLPVRLADELIILARDAGLALAHRPVVEIVADPALRPHTVEVDAGPDAVEMEFGTQASTPISQRAATPEPAPNAFLIVDGRRHVTLDQPLICVGRRRDNQIVIDDSRVSRVHCQIRQRYGRWVLFDLGSSGGTQVNGEPVTEVALRPGDVISLAGVTLIYGEDEAASRPEPDEDTGHTRPLHS